MSADAKGSQLVRDIMLRRYLRLGEAHTIAEVVGFLADPQSGKDDLPYLVVVAQDGAFAGILEPKAIFRALFGAGAPENEDERAALEAAAAMLSLPVGRITDRSVPVLAPDAPLEEAFRLIGGSSSGVIAVLEEGRIVGLVTTRILFETASTLTVGALRGGIVPQQG